MIDGSIVNVIMMAHKTTMTRKITDVADVADVADVDNRPTVERHPSQSQSAGIRPNVNFPFSYILSSFINPNINPKFQ